MGEVKMQTYTVMYIEVPIHDAASGVTECLLMAGKQGSDERSHPEAEV